MMYQANILDPLQPTLPPNVWERPDSPEPTLRPVHAHWITKHIYTTLEQGGYTKPHQWLHLYLTGSLCTFQYSDSSDCDVSLFVDSSSLPEWSRAEMIGLMIEGTEGVVLPGTPYQLQAYVVAKGIHPTDTFKQGLRAGYSIDDHHWISPPDHHLAHDVKAQENGFYVWALEQADKMERLLRYEPDKAVGFWHQIHKRRMRDQTMGKGDYSESNILYKFLNKRGLLPAIAQTSGEHIAGLDFGNGPSSLYDEYGFVKTAVITQDEARGNSRPVSSEEYAQLAEKGRQQYEALNQQSSPTSGLDQNWPQLIDHAWQQAQTPWGGTTIDAHTGEPIHPDADAYALSIRPPGMPTVAVPTGVDSKEFAKAMSRAKNTYQPILERAGHHLGVFHDAEKGSIDFDPVLVVHDPRDVESIGAYTNATGGAYHFQTGAGHFPPHVVDSPAAMAA